jgi:hypothetical protein
MDMLDYAFFHVSYDCEKTGSSEIEGLVQFLLFLRIIML